MDRDLKCASRFRGLLRGEGIRSLRVPSRSPDLEAHIERFFGSLKSECLDQLILFGEQSLRNAVREYLPRPKIGRRLSIGPWDSAAQMVG